MEDAPPRKLAVILHADVVGSTALVQRDERLAHRRIGDAFAHLSTAVGDYGGIAHEVRGDALVAEFERASDAVCAALSFQSGNVERNRLLGDELRPEVRIGIGMGEVVIAGGTVTGAGVVLAQRLEQLADAGGVVIQGAAHETVPRRLPFDYRFLGDRKFKGFDESIRAFTASLRAGHPVPPPESRAPAPPDAPSRRWWFFGAAATALITVAGVLAWLQPWVSQPESVSAQGTATRLPDKPSIAVLPFDNMSDDPGHEHFADGITEDLTTDLSKIAGLFVIARNSAFTYKGKATRPEQVAMELGVRYVLEGSVRRAGEELRINAQLIDATTGGHLWAERFDGSLSDVFGFQDNVATAVVEALSLKLTLQESASLGRQETSNPYAYDAFLAGMRYLDEMRKTQTLAPHAKARQAFEEARKIDPSYPLPYAGLAWTYWADFSFGFGPGGFAPVDLEKAWRLAHQSIELGDNALARRLLVKRHLDPELRGYTSRRADHDAAIAQARKAVALEPGNADAVMELAYVLALAGDIVEAEILLARANRLNPRRPGWYHMPAGIVHFQNRSYEPAIAEFRLAMQGGFLSHSSYWLAAALGYVGKPNEAKLVLEQVAVHAGTGQVASREALAGQLSQFFVAQIIPLKRADDMRHLLDGLDKAGVPKEPTPIN